MRVRGRRSRRGASVADLGLLEPGTHLCSLYRDEAELDRVASAFVAIGLALGDQVLYVASERSPVGVRTALDASGVATAQPLASGQLVVQTFGDFLGHWPRASLAACAFGLRVAAERSRAGGFAGLRIAAEMGDCARLVGSVEHLLAWERLTSRLHREEGIRSVCQYDQRTLDPSGALLIAGEHHGLAPDHAASPLAAFTATRAPWGLRVSGELDVSNRADFIRALAARLSVFPRVNLDVEGLGFVDVGTLAGIYRLAAGLPAEGCIEIAGMSAFLRRVVDMAGFRHSRVVVQP